MGPYRIPVTPSRKHLCVRSTGLQLSALLLSPRRRVKAALRSPVYGILDDVGFRYALDFSADGERTSPQSCKERDLFSSRGLNLREVAVVTSLLSHVDVQLELASTPNSQP